jgi:MFS transporter, DHA2 family, multidrug resistance protein
MINLLRNIGASVGVSMVATLTRRRAQIHQDTLSMHVSNYKPALRGQLTGLAGILFENGVTVPDARRQALGRMYRMVEAQASAEAYLDTLKIFGIACLRMLPLMPLLKKNDPGSRPVGAH